MGRLHLGMHVSDTERGRDACVDDASIDDASIDDARIDDARRLVRCSRRGRGVDTADGIFPAWDVAWYAWVLDINDGAGLRGLTAEESCGGANTLMKGKLTEPLISGAAVAMAAAAEAT